LLAVATLGVGVACSLNPQPLPPGDQPDTGAAQVAEDGGTGGSSPDATTTLGPGDGSAEVDGNKPGVPSADGGGIDSGATSTGDAGSDAAADGSSGVMDDGGQED
jgi:hypothetical protein